MYNIAHSDESYSDIIIINRDLVKGWTMMGVSAGISTETWDAKVYVDNLTDNALSSPGTTSTIGLEQRTPDQ